MRRQEGFPHIHTYDLNITVIMLLVRCLLLSLSSLSFWAQAPVVAVPAWLRGFT